MKRRRRLPSPRIVEPQGPWPWLLLTLLLLAALAGSFFTGVFLAGEQARAIEDRVQVLEEERDGLNERIAVLKQAKIGLERALEIDREANHKAQENLKSAQDERLALEKEVSFLKRLIREGGGGILRVQDFKLERSGEPDAFAYSFTVTQLIQDFGESSGKVQIAVAGKRDGKDATLPLSKLSGSSPTSHKMRFQHFQSFEGQIKVPADFEAENLVVEIKPSTKKLVPVTETFAWKVGD
jgi:hypothetical protein